MHGLNFLIFSRTKLSYQREVGLV